MGKSLAKRYSSLTQPGRIWSSTAERTVKSAEGFINGFMGLKSKSKHANITTTASGNGNGNRNDSIHLVEVEESDDAGANSLTPYKGCSSFSSSYGNDQSSVSPSRSSPVQSSPVPSIDSTGKKKRHY